MMTSEVAMWAVGIIIIIIGAIWSYNKDVNSRIDTRVENKVFEMKNSYFKERLDNIEEEIRLALNSHNETSKKLDQLITMLYEQNRK